jgi:uncharacterized membrane protein
MEARAKIFGHPIHQMLIPIPFGLITTAILLDLVAPLADVPGLTIVSFWNLVIGIGSGLLAAVFGVIDWTAIPRGTRAKRVGVLHALTNVATLGVLAIAVAIRADEQFYGPPGGVVAMELGALLLAIVAGWLGGELVDRLGIGVEPGAHPDAPSSFSRRSAAESDSLSRGARHPEAVGMKAPDSDPTPSQGTPTPA